MFDIGSPQCRFNTSVTIAVGNECIQYISISWL